MTFRKLPVLLLLLPAAAFGQDATYVGVSWFQWTYDEDFAEEASASTLRFSVGTDLNPNLGLETQFATGGSDTVFVSVPGAGSGNVEVELDNSISLMLRPQTSGEEFRAYGLVGFSMGQITATGPGGSFSDDDSGLSYGIGIESTVNESTWLTVDYVNYLRDDAYTFDALSVGVRARF